MFAEAFFRDPEKLSEEFGVKISQNERAMTALCKQRKVGVDSLLNKNLL